MMWKEWRERASSARGTVYNSIPGGETRDGPVPRRAGKIT